MATSLQLQMNLALLLERMGFRKWATREDGIGMYTVKHWLCHDQTPMYCLSKPAYTLGFLQELEQLQYAECPMFSIPCMTYEVLLPKEEYGEIAYGCTCWETLFKVPIRVEQAPNLGAYWASMWRRIHRLRRLRPEALRVSSPIGVMYTEPH